MHWLVAYVSLYSSPENRRDAVQVANVSSSRYVCYHDTV